MNGREGKKGRKGKQTLISDACCCLSEVKLVKNTPHCPFLLLLLARGTSQGFYAGAHSCLCSMALPFAQWGDVFLAEQHTALPEGLRTYCLAGGPAQTH